MSVNNTKSKKKQGSKSINAGLLIAVRLVRHLGYPAANVRQAVCRLAGLNQTSMARMLGLTPQAIHFTIEGFRRSRDTRAKIAALLQLPAEELFFDDEE